MHFDRATNYVPRQFIKFYLRVLRVLRGGELIELTKFSRGPAAE